MSLSIPLSYYELLALHRALMEAKFHGVPNDPVVPGSSLIADVANRVVDALDAWEASEGQASGDTWASWRAIDPSRREWQVAVDRARETDKWSEWSDSERLGYAKILLSPFVVGPELLKQFVASAMANEDPASSTPPE